MKNITLFLMVAFASLMFISACNTQKQKELPPELVYPVTELPSEVKNCEGVLHDPEAMPFSKRDLCYYQLALEHKNPTVCSLIEPEPFEDECYEVLAERMQDYRICGRIHYSGAMGLCYFDFLEEMPVGIEFCEYLTYPSHRDSCMAEMAAFVPNLDYEVCDHVDEFLGRRNTCYKNIALNKGDSGGCMKVGAGTPRDFCYIDFGMKFQDIGFCDSVPYPFKENCLEYVGSTISAVESGDSSICESIPSYDYRDSCIKAVSAKP